MATRPPKRRSRRATGTPRPDLAATRALRALERRVAQLEAEAAAVAARHDRQVAAVRRAADRRLTAMLREIAQLRHHEARAAVLERLVAERDAMLARLGAGRAVPEQPGGPSVPHPAP